MKFVLAVLATAAAWPLAAQDAHAGHSGHADHTAPAATAASAARLNLDTPVETIIADPAGKAVLDARVPGIDTHEHYPMFKTMGLKQLAGHAPDVFTPEVLTKLEAELAAIK